MLLSRCVAGRPRRFPGVLVVARADRQADTAALVIDEPVHAVAPPTERGGPQRRGNVQATVGA